MLNGYHVRKMPFSIGSKVIHHVDDEDADNQLTHYKQTNRERTTKESSTDKINEIQSYQFKYIQTETHHTNTKT